MTAYIVMGVSGSGKTTIGRALAAAYDLPFLDADDFHPQANIEKMAAGTPLTDADRAPWLAALHAEIIRHAENDSGLVMAASALKRAYRDRMRHGVEDIVFIYLKGGKGLIQKRMEQRKGHFFDADMLDSQFKALEEPDPDELVITVAIDQRPEAIIQTIRLEAPPHR